MYNQSRETKPFWPYVAMATTATFLITFVSTIVGISIGSDKDASLVNAGIAPDDGNKYAKEYAGGAAIGGFSASLALILLIVLACCIYRRCSDSNKAVVEQGVFSKSDLNTKTPLLDKPAENKKDKAETASSSDPEVGRAPFDVFDETYPPGADGNFTL